MTPAESVLLKLVDAGCVFFYADGAVDLDDACDPPTLTPDEYAAFEALRDEDDAARAEAVSANLDVQEWKVGDWFTIDPAVFQPSPQREHRVRWIRGEVLGYAVGDQKWAAHMPYCTHVDPPAPAEPVVDQRPQWVRLLNRIGGHDAGTVFPVAWKVRRPEDENPWAVIDTGGAFRLLDGEWEPADAPAAAHIEGHDPADPDAESGCVVCGDQWPCPTAEADDRGAADPPVDKPEPVTFAPGQKVVCVDGWSGDHRLIEGGVYTLAERFHSVSAATGKPTWRTEETGPAYWDQDRFEHAAAAPPVPEEAAEPCAITTGRMGYDWCSTHGHRADVCPGRAAPDAGPEMVAPGAAPIDRHAEGYSAGWKRGFQRGRESFEAPVPAGPEMVAVMLPRSVAVKYAANFHDGDVSEDRFTAYDSVVAACAAALQATAQEETP